MAGYTFDDARQDARIGAWQSLRVPCREGDDYRLGVAALAGYRQILDGRMQRYRASGGGLRECDLAEVPERSVSADAPGLVAVADALAAIERLPEPLPAVAARLIEGEDVEGIARALGVRRAAVDRMRGQLCRVVARAMGETT